MQIFSKEDIETLLGYPSLIAVLKAAFQSDIQVPQRHHHDFENPQESKKSTLLLMPAWEAGKFLGVKMVTVSPCNGKYNLPSIQGNYTLFDAHKGSPIASMDAKTLTVKRTAATSALASFFLSRKNAKTLMLMGTGALAPELIKAHSAIRPIEQVYVWGRNFEKAQELATTFAEANYKVTAIEKAEEYIPKAAIISTATLSEAPILKGQFLVPGQHIDLVGSYLPTSREADDEVIRKGAIFVDTYPGATKESGDIFIPLSTGVLDLNEIKGDLFELCKATKKGRTSDTEITVFKSVGHALEDLAAAKLVYENRQGLVSK